MKTIATTAIALLVALAACSGQYQGTFGPAGSIVRQHCDCSDVAASVWEDPDKGKLLLVRLSDCDTASVKDRKRLLQVLEKELAHAGERFDAVEIAFY